MNFKGSAIITRLRYLDERTDPAAKTRVLARLSPDLQKEIKKGVLSSKWYPFQYYVEINQAIDKIIGNGDLLLLPELGRFSASAAMKWLYSVFYKIESPEFIINKASSLFRQYFDSGQLKVLEKGRRTHGFYAVVDLQDFAAPCREHCLSCAGWIHQTLELSGAKNVRVTEEQCVCQGAKSCRFLAIYS
ncbi:hypothetical protein KAR34_10400 [bacterium]|nr:hypothetical protein [bacterium]